VWLTLQLDAIALRAIKLLPLGHSFVVFTETRSGNSSSSPMPITAATNYSFSISGEGTWLNATQVRQQMEVAAFSATLVIDIAGREWEATFYASPFYLSERRTFQPYYIVIVILMLVVMVTFGTFLGAHRVPCSIICVHVCVLCRVLPVCALTKHRFRLCRSFTFLSSPAMLSRWFEVFHSLQLL
jgi:hypothetical protein